MDQDIKILENYKQNFLLQKQNWEEKVIQQKNEIEQLAKEKSEGFPWLAKAFSDYYYFQKLKEADYLKHKSHPAPVSAERVREVARERRVIEEKLRITQWIINYY